MQILQDNVVPEELDCSWFTALDPIIQSEFDLSQGISVAFVEPKEMQKLNKKYRKKDYATDILSFSIDSDELLGELILCLPVLQKQAAEKRHSVTREFQILVIHGVLHLLGFDHEVDAEAEVMEKREKQLLAKLETALAQK